VSHAKRERQRIFLDQNAAGTITFSGTGSVLNGGTADAVHLTSNTGATINFTGGGLNIDTTSATGFNASGGGTVTVTGSGNVIDTTTGAGLIIANTTIGANDVTFQHITSGSRSTATGILDTTGSSGGLHVTGTSTTAGTGGTISIRPGGRQHRDWHRHLSEQYVERAAADMQLNDSKLCDLG
jgi:hypothetical protein